MNHIRGFTLIEILVAFTVFALVGGLLLQTFQEGLRAANEAERRAHAALVARSKLAELAADENLQPSTGEGRETNGISWRVIVEEAPELASDGLVPLTPLRSRITVLWGEGPRQRLAVETLVVSKWRP